MRRFVVPAILFLALIGCASATRTTVDDVPITVLTNAKIFTSDGANPWAEAIAMRGDRIFAVGRSGEVLMTAQKKSSRVESHDVKGRVIVPGFNDAHFHGGAYPEHVALEFSAQDPEVAEVMAKAREAVSGRPAGTWIMGDVGGRVLNDPAVDRAALDAISTTHPIVLTSWAGHGSVANSPALSGFGYDDATPDPMGGTLGRTADGKLNGRLDEYAGYQASRQFAAAVPQEDRVARYQNSSRILAARGITSVQNMSNVRPAPEAAATIAAAASPLRWRVIRFPMTTATSFGAGEEVAALPGSRPGAKWILDGTPVERGAAMTVPYADAPVAGTLNFSRDTIAKMLEDADGRGEQPMFHAVGDEAIDAMLDAMDATGGAARWNGKRVRLEHGDMATAAQLVRLRELGVVYVQNPAHVSLVEMMKERYAPRVDAVQPVRSVGAAGVPFAIGSDGPTNPFLNIMFATLHPVTPGEALTREEAVIAYTLGSAYAEFAENEKGSLTVGKLADLAVLDGDPFTASPDQLPKIRSVMTMVGGNVVHGALKFE
jgi:predicted amidohydrolase YtcJ